jgi:hypothetical protein
MVSPSSFGDSFGQNAVRFIKRITSLGDLGDAQSVRAEAALGAEADVAVVIGVRGLTLGRAIWQSPRRGNRLAGDGAPFASLTLTTPVTATVLLVSSVADSVMLVLRNDVDVRIEMVPLALSEYTNDLLVLLSPVAVAVMR